MCAGDSKDPLNTRANPANLVSPLDEEAEEDSDEDSSAEEGEEDSDDDKKKKKKKSKVQKYRPPKMTAEKFEDSSCTCHAQRRHHTHVLPQLTFSFLSRRTCSALTKGEGGEEKEEGTEQRPRPGSPQRFVHALSFLSRPTR